jgi:hypothetical protein
MGGFTMVEVLLTLMIMGMILVSMTSILTAARTSRDTIHNIQETQLAGPAIMDRLERDLRGIVTFNRPREELLRVVDRVIAGMDGDSIDFVTSNDSLLFYPEGDIFLRADMNEVGYRLRANPADNDFLEIYRRESFGVDDEPFDDGLYTFLHDRVKGFSILVYTEDGIDAEHLEEWGVLEDDPEFQGLPTRLEIELTLELSPRIMREQLPVARVDMREVTYRRVIRIPDSIRWDVGQIPMLAIPGTVASADAGNIGAGTPATAAGSDWGAGGASGRGGDAGKTIQGEIRDAPDAKSD